VTLKHGKSSREYPDRPLVGVGGVVIDDGRALLIRRGSEPLLGEWSIPGGTLELGETLEEGVARELVSRINEWRGDLKLPYEQRISLAIKGSAKLESVAKKFAEPIAKETLASSQTVGETPSGYETLEVEVDGEKATLALKRV